MAHPELAFDVTGRKGMLPSVNSTFVRRLLMTALCLAAAHSLTAAPLKP
jgi:hypothetical protein